MKRLLLLAFLAAVVVAIPAQARAAEPCRNKVFNDWYADGRIASTYPHACYVDALRHIPIDAKVYSSLGDDIRTAMRAALNRSEGKSVPSQVGHGFAALTSGGVKATETTKTDPHDPAPSPDPASTVAAGNTSSSSGLPLPIIILGALALILAAAGALGTGVKYARSRRPGA